MIKLILVLTVAVSVLVTKLNAAACYNPLTLSSDTCTSPNTDCPYTQTLAATSGLWTSTYWPVFSYTVGCSTTSSCSPTTAAVGTAGRKCGTSAPATATLANLPTVASCYTGSDVTAATLTSSSLTASPCSTSYYCDANIITMNSVVTATMRCTPSAAVCSPGSTSLCSMVANTNYPFACYVGAYYTIGTGTFAKSICLPQSSGGTYVSAVYCKNVYSYSSTNGIIVTGSCATACVAATVTTTSSSATGTTCSSIMYGNAYTPSDASPNAAFSVFAMILSSIMALVTIHL